MDGNWSRGDVEYCVDFCTSLKSFEALAAGRLKNSISYESLLVHVSPSRSPAAAGEFFFFWRGSSRVLWGPDSQDTFYAIENSGD